MVVVVEGARGLIRAARRGSNHFTGTLGDQTLFKAASLLHLLFHTTKLKQSCVKTLKQKPYCLHKRFRCSKPSLPGNGGNRPEIHQARANLANKAF